MVRPVASPSHNSAYLEDAVCRGPYWNNSRHTKKLKLKFISKKLRDYLEKADELYEPMKIYRERFTTSQQMDENPIYKTRPTYISLKEKYDKFISTDVNFAIIEKAIRDNEENQLKLLHQQNSSGGRNRSRRQKTRRR